MAHSTTFKTVFGTRSALVQRPQLVTFLVTVRRNLDSTAAAVVAVVNSSSVASKRGITSGC